MPSLTATYTSPTSEPQTFTQPLPAPSSSPSTADRTAYLAFLQSSIRNLQGEVNTFLTQRMEDDKALVGKLDDAQAEETYGEELPEED
ncbi:hypothetical protein K458DRAFT_291731 [Lentithecium fluviatile CBS 122367]|uniref:EKC/KEOPS complex subunit GON7 n=1 Tax=Lentithecium fluviatile CBS 122367 TaxID=1168545 RepID=A0A6G1JHU6_9PLEO|nr:hypothetical protein K458DRAFT_291731 [Lentithecium fluviatile CBS 122367]